MHHAILQYISQKLCLILLIAVMTYNQVQYFRINHLAGEFNITCNNTVHVYRQCVFTRVVELVTSVQCNRNIC